ncbi:MAG: bifunctional DedA family/phosphatase PAP2 family protein [Candidatus Falkowbacteria bacterium]|nr:bifunctional DedA family/phosphatase PAP2 family protein [Candidatus Falkowbacteria bacterium]
MSIIDQILNIHSDVLTYWGYAIIFLFALLETFPMVGLFIPGMLIIMLGGFLAKMGTLSLVNVIVVALIGAITGNVVGYFLGKKVGYSFIIKYGRYFFIKEHHFEKTKQLLHKHAGKAILFGNFNALTRSVIPFIAGATDIAFFKFFLFNLIGGAGLVLALTSIGYVFGQSYEIISVYIGKFIFVGLVVGILIILFYRFINKRKKIFTISHLYALSANIVSLYFLAKITEDVHSSKYALKVDIWINQVISVFRSPFLDRVMPLITGLGGMSVLAVFTIVLGVWLVYEKKMYHLSLLFFSMFCGAASVSLMKSIIQRARPTNPLIGADATGYGFPSGHATMSLIFFCVLLYVFKDDIKNKTLKILFGIVNIAMFLLIGFSRVYLNAHWASDVMAGFALGLFWVSLTILLLKAIIFITKLEKGFIKGLFTKI